MYTIKRIRPLRIYKQYFDMILAGTKTVEVRVAYSSMLNIKEGDVIRFMCQDTTCDKTVERVAKYRSFDEMMSKEDPKRINPYREANEQIKDIKKIFPPHKERLGVLVFQLGKAI